MEKDSLNRFEVSGFVDGRFVQRPFISLKDADDFFDCIRDTMNFSMVSLFDFFDEDNPTSFKVLRVCFG